MKHNYTASFCFKSSLIFIVLSTVVLNGFAATKRLVAGTHFDPKDPTVQYFPVIDEDGNNDSKLFFFGNPEKQHFRATSQYPSYGGHDHRWLRYSTSSTLENNKYVCSTTDRITGGKDGDGYTFGKVDRDGFFFISKPGYSEYSVLGEFDMVGLAPGTVYDIEIGWYNISDTYWSGNDGARILVEVYSNGSFVKRFTWNDYVYANSGLQTSSATVTVPAGKNSLEVFIFNNYSKYRSMIAVDYILVYGQGLYITPDSEGPYPAGEEVVLTANDGTAPYTWYQSVDNGATYTVISGQTGSSITVSPTQRTIYKCVDAGKAEDTYEINPTVICDATKTKTLFSETFGTLSSETARSSTSYCPYTYIEACKPIKNGGEYAIVALPKWGGCGTQASDANSCECTSDFWFNSKYDHTQGGLKDGKYGGMLMLNCNNIGDVLYERTVDVCSQSYLLFSVWVTAANMSDVDPIKAKFVLRGGGKTGPVIDEYEVKNIDVNAGWKQISAMFNSGTYSQVTIQLVNLAPAGQKGNDLLVDDIEFKACNPESYLYVDELTERQDTVLLCPYNNGSQKESVTLKTVINGSAFSNPYYYWQKSSDGTTWAATPISGSGQGSSFKNLTITSGDCGYYRVIIATSQADAQAIAEDPTSKVGCGLYSISNTSHIECRDLEITVSTPVKCIGSDKAKYTVSVVNTLPYIVTAKTIVSCQLSAAAGYTNSHIDNLTPSLSSINAIKRSEIAWDVEIAKLPAYKKGAATQDTIKFVYYATPTTTAAEVASWFFIAEAKGLTNPNQMSCPEKSKYLVKDGVSQTCDDVTLSISTTKDAFCLGDDVVYTIKAKNNLDVATSDVNIKVTIPANQQYKSCVGGTYNTSTFTIAVGSLTANQEKTITFTTTSISAGDGTLSIVLTNDDASKKTKEITVNALPTASISGDAAVCQNGSLTLTGSGADNYSWNGGAYSTTNTFDVTTTTSGAQTIKLKVKDANGCESAEKSKSVTVNALPTASISGDAAVCQNGSLTLTGSGADNYSWNGGAYSTTSTFDVTTTTAGAQTIKLKVKDANGCESTEKSKSVTVNALPTASSSNVVNNTRCTSPYNGEYTITATGGSGTYTYSNDGGASYSSTATYPGLQSASVTAKVKDSNGCVSEGVSISVSDNSHTPIQYVVIYGGIYCSDGDGVRVGLSKSETGFTYTLYRDDVSTGISLAGTGNELDFGKQKVEGTYTAKAENATTGCSADMDGDTDVAVDQKPTNNAGSTQEVCNTTDFTLAGTANGNVSTWTIKSYDGTTNPTIENPTSLTSKVTGVELGKTAVLTLTTTSLYNQCTPATSEVTLKNKDCTSLTLTVTTETPICAGGTSNYKIEVYNGSTVKATGVTVIYTKPGDTTPYTWTIGDIAASGKKTESMQYTPDATTATTTVNVSAYVSAVNGNTYASYEASEAKDKKDIVVNALPTISYKVYKGSTEEEMSSPYTITCTDQSARVVLSGGATYKWSDNKTEAERIFTDAANLTVKSVSAEGCESSNSETIEITKNTSTPNVSVTPTSGTIDCATTSITLTASSTTEGVTYKWNDASSTTGSTLTVSDAGTYTVTATATNGCTNTASATITKDVELPNVSVTPTSGTIDCSTTSITLTASSTTAGVTYKWNDASSTTGTTLTVSDAGTYTVTATATNGCTNTASATITKDVELPNVSVTPTSGTIDCTTTSITLTASSTTAGVTYKWNDASSTTGSTLTVSDAGTYTVTATATNGCTNTASATITKDVELPNVSVTPTSGTIDCATTSITLTASSTTAGVTYKWNDASSTTGSTLTVSDAGTYTVTATATNGCTNTASATITKDVELPNVSVTPTSGTIDCSTTSITLTASSTTAGVTYKWNDASSTTGSTLTVSDAGTYTVTATATNGCTNTASSTITKDVDAPNVSVTPTSGTIDCTTTSITLTASSTTAGVTYKWNDASSTTGTTLTVSDAGTYTVTATATNGCTNTASATITKDVELPNVSVTPTSGTIDCTTTSITLTASSTTAGVTYKWNDASSTTGSTLTVSEAGTYTVTATATNGCTNTAGSTITKNVDKPNVSVTPTSGTIDCTTTSITLEANSTTTGVTYMWNDASSTTGSTLTVSDAGTYTVTATATNGCTNTASATITKDVELPNVSVTPTSGTIDCATTSITLEASSTTEGVTYKWDDASSTTGSTLTVSDAGTYTVTATATNGCTNTANATISKNVEKPAAPISLGDKEYCDQSTIETLAVQAPADVKYEIKWYDNSNIYLASGTTYTPVSEPAVGSTDTYYAETYNTENHCASEEKTALTITRNALPNPEATNNTPICSGETVELSVDAYTSYSWSGPQSFTSTEQNPKIENATVDATGDYTVEVTDANGCKNTSTTAVTVNPTPELTYTAFDPLTGLEVSEPYKLDCNVPSIRVELSGGSTYQWSDGKTEQSRTIENAGTYSVYPISDKGCIGEEKTISVTSNKNKPVLKLSSKDAEGNDNTLLTCTVEELTLDVEVLNPDVATDVTYEWTFTDGSSTDKSIVVTKPDTYKMVAQAANGCYSDENKIVITQDIRVPVVTIDAPADILTCVTEFITLEAKADIENCTFEWNDGSTESTLKVSAEGLYSVKATATNGCVSLAAEKEITDKTQIPVIEITPSAEKVTCENVILTASSESEGMTYVWSDEFATTGATLEVSKKGTYTVTGTNMYSCVGEASFDIDEDKSAPVITITPNKGTLTCEITSIDVEATETSGIASVSYKWSNGKTTAENNFTEKGTYTVTATNDATACKSQKSVTINENKQYPIVALQALEAVCLPATVDISKAVVVSESKFDDIKYYYDAAGTQPLDNPVVDVVTKQIFYVQGFGVEGSGCVGQQIYPIEVMLKDVTSTPVVNNYDECPAAMSKSLKEQVVSDRSNLTFYDMPEGGAPRSDMFDASKENTDAVYYVTNTEAGKCESERAEIDVHIDGTIDIEVTADDDEVYAGQQEVTVSAKSIKESQVNNYKWQKNALVLPETGNEVTTLLYSNTKFTVTGEGRCNSVSKEITIRALWPTLITPKTGANGHFAKGCDITVFNRFNEKVFQGNDGWDGTLDCNFAPKGEIASPGVYYYYINIPDGGTHRGTIEVVKF